MKFAIRLLLLLLLITALSHTHFPPAWAQESSVSVRKVKTQNAEVILNGAVVYNDPHFDAEIISYLPAGKSYQVSAEKRGPFFRIRLGPNTFGWIADVDVDTELQGRVQGPEATASLEKGADQGTAMFLQSMDDVGSDNDFDAIYFKRFGGPLLAQVGFSEQTFDGIKTADLTMYGVKIAGPDVLYKGPGLTEFNFLYYGGAPEYYETLTGHSADGTLLLADFLLTTPFLGAENYMMYYSVGPLVRWSSFDVTIGESLLNLQDLNLGATIEVGAAVDLGKVGFRIEYRYYWEVTKYDGWAATLQVVF